MAFLLEGGQPGASGGIGVNLDFPKFLGYYTSLFPTLFFLTVPVKSPLWYWLLRVETILCTFTSPCLPSTGLGTYLTLCKFLLRVFIGGHWVYDGELHLLSLLTLFKLCFVSFLCVCFQIKNFQISAK